MAFLELPHWLMIGGAVLMIAGFIGLALDRNKQVGADPASLPGDELKPKSHGLDSKPEQPEL